MVKLKSFISLIKIALIKLMNLLPKNYFVVFFRVNF